METLAFSCSKRMNACKWTSKKLIKRNFSPSLSFLKEKIISQIVQMEVFTTMKFEFPWTFFFFCFKQIWRGWEGKGRNVVFCVVLIFWGSFCRLYKDLRERTGDWKVPLIFSKILQCFFCVKSSLFVFVFFSGAVSFKARRFIAVVAFS